MGLGLGRLRLPPDQFWRMTPRELTAAAEALLGPGRPPAPTRAEFARLLAIYPDR